MVSSMKFSITVFFSWLNPVRPVIKTLKLFFIYGFKFAKKGYFECRLYAGQWNLNHALGNSPESGYKEWLYEKFIKVYRLHHREKKRAPSPHPRHDRPSCFSYTNLRDQVSHSQWWLPHKYPLWRIQLNAVSPSPHLFPNEHLPIQTYVLAVLNRLVLHHALQKSLHNPLQTMVAQSVGVGKFWPRWHSILSPNIQIRFRHGFFWDSVGHRSRIWLTHVTYISLPITRWPSTFNRIPGQLGHMWLTIFVLPKTQTIIM